jgi:hypothetical protein
MEYLSELWSDTSNEGSPDAAETAESPKEKGKRATGGTSQDSGCKPKRRIITPRDENSETTEDEEDGEETDE